MKNPINKLLLFLGMFFLAYALIIIAMSSGFLKPALHSFYKNSSIAVAEGILGRSEIQSQFERDGRTMNYDRFIIRIGANEAEIQRRIAEARKLMLKEISNPVCDIPFKPFEFYTVPLAFILSLLIVTPGRWQKVLIRILLGFGIMMFFLWFKFLIQVLFSINFIYPIDMYELGSLGKSLVSFLSQAMTMGLSVILGVIIWLSLSFRDLPIEELKMRFKA